MIIEFIVSVVFAWYFCSLYCSQKILQNRSRYPLFWCVDCLFGLLLLINNTALILSHHFNILRLFLSRDYKCHRGHNHNDQGEVEHCNRMTMMTLLVWVLMIENKYFFSFIYMLSTLRSFIFNVDWWLFISTFLCLQMDAKSSTKLYMTSKCIWHIFEIYTDKYLNNITF